MVGVVNWMVDRAENVKLAVPPLTDRLRPLIRCTHPEGTPRVVYMATIRQVCPVVGT